MVAYCAVVGCKSTWNPFTTVSFHRITKNKKILPFWLRAVNLKLSEHAKICSLHFRANDVVDGKGGKRLRWDAVPFSNVNRVEDNDTDDNDCDEDEEDNKNLSTLKKQLAADSNAGPPATQDNDDSTDESQPETFEMVACCNAPNCNAKSTGSARLIETKDTATQVNRTTEGEISLRQRIKVLGSRLKRREAKISYMKTVFNMIKKHVKGTDMEYKLSCELQNISEFSEPIKTEVKKTRNTKQAKAQSPVSDHCSNDDEESSGDENGMCIEVTLSPNLKPRNGVQL